METPDEARPRITLRVVENGRDWTAEELARVTVAPDEDPDDFAPLESAQAQLEALGYRVIALGGVGLYIMAHVERRCGLPVQGGTCALPAGHTQDGGCSLGLAALADMFRPRRARSPR